MNFPTHVRAQLITALGSISLWVQDLDDDPPALVEAFATWVRTEG